MCTRILNATLLLPRISAEALKVNVKVWSPQEVEPQAEDLGDCSLVGAGRRKRAVKQEKEEEPVPGYEMLLAMAKGN